MFTANNTKTGARMLAVQARHNRAVALRKEGKTYAEIATELGYCDKAAAYKGVRSAMKSSMREVAAPVLSMELERLDDLQFHASALTKLAEETNNHEALARAMGLSLAVMDRRARYLGLYETGPALMNERVIEEEVERLSKEFGLERFAILEAAEEVIRGRQKS